MAPTGFFLLDNPNPNVSQYGLVRRNGEKVSGVMVAHSTESAPDWVGPDTGAENVARWVALVRDSYGSYHEIIDSDSEIPMAPLYAETWHCVYTNNHAIGYSMAMQAAKWHLMPEDRRIMMFDRTAKRISEGIKWVKNNRGIVVPVRLLTRAEALNKTPGITYHGITDPARRSDPFVKHTLFATYNEYFLSKIAEYLGQGGAVKPPEPVVVKPPTTAPTDYNKYGYSKARIESIQLYLKKTGFYLGEVDGFYGYWTWNAVKTYQGVQVYWPGREVDGFWGPRTQAHKDWTLRLQETLNKWKGYDIRADGDYGKVTAGRVRYTQERNGLWPDGIAGPKTCALLGIPTHP